MPGPQPGTKWRAGAGGVVNTVPEAQWSIKKCAFPFPLPLNRKNHTSSPSVKDTHNFTAANDPQTEIVIVGTNFSSSLSIYLGIITGD